MTGDLEARHRALIARDREIGLMAQAETAQAHAAHVEAELDLARVRLARKNKRIELLTQRVSDLEGELAGPPEAASNARLRRGLRRGRRSD